MLTKRRCGRPTGERAKKILMDNPAQLYEFWAAASRRDARANLIVP
jgi:hypothetical protein